MKKILYIATIFLLITTTTASAASGMSADELRAEIARLSRVADTIRAQLLKFGNDPNTVTPGSANTGIDPSTVNTNIYSGAACLQSNLRMRRGHSGGSVSTLQQFLAQQGVYSASLVTGYYGPATQIGVQSWQASHGVVSGGTPTTTGYGVVGPATLRAMHAGCPGGAYSGQSGSLTGATAARSPRGSGGSRTSTNGVSPQGVVAVEKYSLAINPTRGLAPMNVTAEFTIDGSTCTSYVLDWGDGALPVSYNSNRSTACTPLPIKVSKTHIYNTSGVHTVLFKTGKAPITQIKTVSNLDITLLGLPQTSY